MEYITCRRDFMKRCTHPTRAVCPVYEICQRSERNAKLAKTKLYPGIGTVTINTPWRNHGYSLGLDYPYLYGKGLGRWLVWHRHTGIVVYIVPKINRQLWEGFEEQEAMDICYRLNGLSKLPSAEMLDAIDSTP